MLGVSLALTPGNPVLAPRGSGGGGGGTTANRIVDSNGNPVVDSMSNQVVKAA